MAPVSFPSVETVECLGIGSFIMVEWETVEKYLRVPVDIGTLLEVRKEREKGKHSYKGH